MYAQTKEKTKIDRAQETIEKLLDLVPSGQKMLLMAFLPQFRQSFKSVTEEQIDHVIEVIEKQIAYIKEG